MRSTEWAYINTYVGDGKRLYNQYSIIGILSGSKDQHHLQHDSSVQVASQAIGDSHISRGGHIG